MPEIYAQLTVTSCESVHGQKSRIQKTLMHIVILI